jgi:hypothetical protein
MSDTRPVSVRGGSDGIEAHCADLLQLAREFGGASVDTTGQALQLHGYLVHPAVLAAAALDPYGAADFSTELLAALDGHSGLTWRAIECGALDVGLRAAAVVYERADGIRTQVELAIDATRHAAPGTFAAIPELVHGDFSDAFQAFLAEDPAAIDVTLGFVSTFWRDYAAAFTVARLPDGRPHVTAQGSDPEAGEPPRSVADLIRGVAHRSSGRGGDIDVRFVIGSDGQRRVIVDIPGTRSWTPLPTPDVTNLTTNLKAINGVPTTYQDGVLEAMRQAGVRATDQVLLVGHSQGGMVAVNAAAAAARSREFRVTNVVTAGSPLAKLPTPGSVNVLALENDGDIVPHLDGAANADRTNLTTVTVHHRHRLALDNHDLQKSYLPGAEDIAASTNKSVRDAVKSLQPFLDGRAVQTEVFHVERI